MRVDNVDGLAGDSTGPGATNRRHRDLNTGTTDLGIDDG